MFRLTASSRSLSLYQLLLHGPHTGKGRTAQGVATATTTLWDLQTLRVVIFIS